MRPCATCQRAAADHRTTLGLCTTSAFCYVPNSFFFTSRTRVPSRSSPLPTATQNSLSTNAISTNLALFVLHVEARFMVQPASFFVRVKPTYPKGLPNRHPPSLTDGCCLFLRAVILWRCSVDLHRDACTPSQCHSPPTTPPCQMHSAPAVYLPLLSPCREALSQ